MRPRAVAVARRSRRPIERRAQHRECRGSCCYDTTVRGSGEQSARLREVPARWRHLPASAQFLTLVKSPLAIARSGIFAPQRVLASRAKSQRPMVDPAPRNPPKPANRSSATPCWTIFEAPRSRPSFALIVRICLFLCSRTLPKTRS